MIEIQIIAAPAFEQLVKLDGTFFTIGLRWNARLGAWVLDVSDSSGNPILMGSPLRVGMVIGWLASLADLLPAGRFMAFDTSGQDLDPELDDLGQRVRLFYFEAADLPALEVAA